MSGQPDDSTADGPRAGTVALVGRPNAGKSTLMNLWLEEKVAIVSDKPQTTRQRIVGILSGERGQIVFYDTPGVHRPQHRMNQRMVKAAQEALNDADVVCLLVDVSQKPGSGDRFMRRWVSQVEAWMDDEQVEKARRADAMTSLQQLALAQAKWRANNTAYTATLTDVWDNFDGTTAKSLDGHYTLAIVTGSVSPTGFQAMAYAPGHGRPLTTTVHRSPSLATAATSLPSGANTASVTRSPSLMSTTSLPTASTWPATTRPSCGSSTS